MIIGDYCEKIDCVHELLKIQNNIKLFLTESVVKEKNTFEIDRQNNNEKEESKNLHPQWNVGPLVINEKKKL